MLCENGYFFEWPIRIMMMIMTRQHPVKQKLECGTNHVKSRLLFKLLFMIWHYIHTHKKNTNKQTKVTNRKKTTMMMFINNNLFKIDIIEIYHFRMMGNSHYFENYKYIQFQKRQFAWHFFSRHWKTLLWIYQMIPI